MAKAVGVAESFDGILSELENMPEQEANWRVDEDANFVLELPDPRPNRANSFVFTCSGNVESQTIEFLQLGQEEFRPASGEVWSF